MRNAPWHSGAGGRMDFIRMSGVALFQRAIGAQFHGRHDDGEVAQLAHRIARNPPDTQTDERTAFAPRIALVRIGDFGRRATDRAFREHRVRRRTDSDQPGEESEAG